MRLRIREKRLGSREREKLAEHQEDAPATGYLAGGCSTLFAPFIDLTWIHSAIGLS